MNRATLLNVICISFLLLFVSSQKVQAQNESENSLEKCQRLYNEGKKAQRDNKFALALELLIKSEELAEKNMLNKKLISIKLEIGTTYSTLSNYGEALNYYKQALDLSNTTGLTDLKARVLTSIGNLYNKRQDYQNAIIYYKESYRLVNSSDAAYTGTITAINISDLYNKIGNYKEARKYLLDVKDITKSKQLQQFWYINFAESLLIEGRITEAKNIAGKLLKNMDGEYGDICNVCTAELLSKIYDKENDIANAILYASQALHNTDELNEKIKFYNQLSELYYKNNQYNQSKMFKDSVIFAKDSLAIIINNGLFASTQVKLKVQEYENESKSYRERQEAERKLFIICGIFGIITFLFIYRVLKSRIAKHKQEKIIVEKQRQIISLELEQRSNQNMLLKQEMLEKETNGLLEKEQLKNEIDKRNRQLSAKALNLSGRNQIIEDIIIAFGQNSKLKRDATLLKHIDDLKANLKSDEWDTFILHFEEVNNNMLKRLQANYPSLTSNDLKFIAYLYMNLSYKEIAIIFNITATACSKRRERISAKMNLPKDVSLQSYISSF